MTRSRQCAGDKPIRADTPSLWAVLLLLLSLAFAAAAVILLVMALR